MVLRALLLISLAVNGPAAHQEAERSAPPSGKSGWRFAALPLLSYGSDIGWTLGGALYFYRSLLREPDVQDALRLSSSYATRGPRAADAQYDLRQPAGTSLRASWHMHLGDDPLMPYWGEGAQLGGLGISPGSGTPPAPYRYHDRRIFLSSRLRGALAGPLGWHVRLRFLDVDVAEQSALLAASSPPGAHGGRVVLGEVGLLYDTRDREVETRRGVFAAVAGFVAPRMGGLADLSFHGYDASLRLYVPLRFGVTLALRGLYDRKDSGAPFFERMLYEGIAYDEGLGGAGTIRGVARYRVSGDEKALGNAELRAIVLSSNFGGRLQEYGVSFGVDAGWARQPGYAPVADVGLATGLRFIWDRAVAVRLELGYSPGGEAAVYVAFGERY